MLDWIFLLAAVIGGTVLVCQFALTLLGLGDHGGDISHMGGGAHVGDFSGHHIGDSHVGGDASHPDSTHLFGVITFRTVVAAAAFFGATGKAALGANYAPSTAFILAAIVGLFAMYGMYQLMRLITGLDSSGNERIDNAVGSKATVYIRVPATRGGVGKVQLSMQNRIVEYQAVTDDAEPLRTGEIVQVVAVEGSDTVAVRRAVESIPQEVAAL
jgi:membrane protein implicated in regulation of membrane protease activity